MFQTSSSAIQAIMKYFKNECPSDAHRSLNPCCIYFNSVNAIAARVTSKNRMPISTGIPRKSDNISAISLGKA